MSMMLMAGSRPAAHSRVAPIPRSAISIGLARELRGRLASLAQGRTLMIDFFASRCCTSVAVGDLTARWVDDPPVEGFVALAAIEGVPIRANERLLELLATAGPSVCLGGLPFARHLAVELDDPAAWIDFLGTPAALRRR